MHININRKVIYNLINNKCRLIVHTIRAREQIKLLYDYSDVDVHPLIFIGSTTNIDSNIISKIKKDLNIEDNAIIIGIFGYLSPYKGHLEALEGLKLLPTQYKLMIFGRQHPQSLRSEQVDSYLNLLVSKARKSKKLRDRVLFMGELNDQDFISAASQVDIAWLPYYENGQDGSGIASICCSVAKRVLASSSIAFDELMRLIPYKHVMRFDIGNFLEMAVKTKMALSSITDNSIPKYCESYNIETQAMLYIKDLYNTTENSVKG